MKDRKTAAALQYRINEDNAPRVVAAGRGITAQRIIELAREHDVPIHEDAELAAILSLHTSKQRVLDRLSALFAIPVNIFANFIRFGMILDNCASLFNTTAIILSVLIFEIPTKISFGAINCTVASEGRI